MDLIGDIVEHPLESPTPPTPPCSKSSSNSNTNNGFPLAAKTRPSQWKSRLNKKGLSSMSDFIKSDHPSSTIPSNKDKDNKFYTTDPKTGFKRFKDKKDKKLDYTGLSESESIHQENIEILSTMSNLELEETKNELMNTLDPKILQFLLSRSSKDNNKSANDDTNNNSQSQIPNSSILESNDGFPVIAGPGTWIGGDKSGNLIQSDSDDTTTISNNTSSPNFKPAFRKNSSSSSMDKKVRFKNETTIKYMDAKSPVLTISSGKQQSTKSSSENSSNDQSIEDDDEEEWEDIQYLDDDLAPPHPTPITPPATNDSIHFPNPPKNSAPYLDINDPNFNEKLREIYFPDFEKNPKSLDWTKPIANPNTEQGQQEPLIYQSVRSLRFDFNGALVTQEVIDSYKRNGTGKDDGLYHHSENPELPGYTLVELAHLMRSTFNGQRCLSIRTIGRIIYNLNELEFVIVDEDDLQQTDPDTTDASTTTRGVSKFKYDIWCLILDLQILDILNDIVNNSNTRRPNVSLVNYATEALYLWQRSGGDEIVKKVIERRKLEENIDTQ